MKVTFEGTTEEVIELADLLGYGKISCYTVRDPQSGGTTTRNVGDDQARDDVPNRYREEGVQ